MAKSKYSKETFYSEFLRIHKLNNNISKKIFIENNKIGIGKSTTEHYLYKNKKKKNICKELGLNYKQTKVSDEELIEAGLIIYEKHGKLTKELFEAESKYSWCAIQGHFGSFSNFLKLLNIEQNLTIAPDIEEVKQDVYNFCIKHKTTNSSDYRKYGRYNQCFIDRYFGGWTKLMKLLNLNIMKEKPGFDYMLKEVQKLYNKYGYISCKLINDNCSFTYQAFSCYFNDIEEISLAVSNNKTRYVFNTSWLSDDALRLYNILVKIYGKENICLEKTFDWLITDKGTKMRIDFFIENIDLCIEYDGKQHEEYIPFFHRDKKAFLDQKERDKVKEKLIKEHNLILIRINYKDDISEKNIKKIIKKITKL